MGKSKNIKLPSGIDPTPQGHYRAAVCYKGIRKSVVVDTLEEAIIARAEMINQLRLEAQARQDATTTWTLRQAFERTKTLRWAGAKSSDKLIYNGEAAVKFFGPDTLVTHITTNLIDEWVEELMGVAKNGNSTINRKLSALSTMLTMAKERGQLDELPVIARRKENTNRIVFFSPEEEEKILKLFAYFGREDHREASIMLVDTGFRPSELWGLEAKNVDQRNKSISLWKTKNDLPRTVPMTGRVVTIMAVRCKKYPKGQLFPGSSNDWYGNIWERVRAHLNRADDPHFIPYAWRHTCCSRLVQRGVPLLHVKEWMGHKSIQTTMRYAHLATSDLFALARVLEGGDDARWSAGEEVGGNDETKSEDDEKTLLQ